MDEQFKFKKIGISDAYLISLKKNEDARGEVIKKLSRNVFLQHGINFNPNEEIIIRSKKNVLRGLHFQKNGGQSKLVSLIKGKIFCVILDVNKNSKSFGQWITIELDSGLKEVLIPADCALGTYALEDSVFSCIFDGEYRGKDCIGIAWNDPDLGINWPIEMKPIVSEKDNNLCLFTEYIKNEG